jgi:hypothetical protein
MGTIRPFDIRDVSAVQRLSSLGRMLAYELVAVDGLNPLREAMRAYISAGYDHTVALIRRDPNARERDTRDTFGLMQLIPVRKAEQETARYAALLYMSPAAQNDEVEEAWAELAEAFVMYATENGVQCIVAETPESGHEAEALHRVGFSALMHQDIMKLAALPQEMEAPDVIGLRAQEERDELYVKLLSMRVVPKLVQKAEGATDLTRLTHRSDCGFILMRNQDPLAHVSFRQGRRGYGMQVLFRQDAEDLAEPVLQYALSNLCDRTRRPVYCMIPSYQSWLLPVLDGLGFTHITSNTIMVKHTTARVRQPVWSLQPNHAGTKLIKGETKLHHHQSNARHHT